VDGSTVVVLTVDTCDVVTVDVVVSLVGDGKELDVTKSTGSQ
jgi:hypothetical protein